MSIALERITENSVAARNFQKIQSAWIKGPAQARVFNSANIATVNTTAKVLTFDSERYDTGDFHSTASNTDRLTIPTDGLYAIGGSVQFASNATGYRQVEILLNASSAIGGVVHQAVNGAVTVVNTSTEHQLAAGDFVTLRVTQASGGALNVVATGDYSPEFWIHRIGSQG